jgi:biopolymer transport protein ExbD
MPRRARKARDARLDVNLTPLLDVVLQLVTFFMMLVHFGTRLEGAALEVRLPVAPAALPGGKPSVDRLVIGIDAQGRLLVQDEAREGFAAEAWWAAEASRRRAGMAALGQTTDEIPTLVVVRADRAAAYGAVRRALAVAQGRGFANFTLVVMRGRP